MLHYTLYFFYFKQFFVVFQDFLLTILLDFISVWFALIVLGISSENLKALSLVLYAVKTLAKM
jgi:hypothetical protein